jgi:SAM-dependent methyltransferase
MSFRMNTPEGKSILAMVREGDYAHPGEEDAIRRVADALPRESLHRILDVGCGRGGTADWFLRHGCSSVVGVDIDALSIDYARSRFPGVEFHAWGVAELDRWCGEPFDLAYLFNSFYAFPDQAAALRAIRRVCATDGHLALFDYTKPADVPSPGELGSAIGMPMVLTTLHDWLRDAGWTIVAIDDWTSSYVSWYEALLERFARLRPRITVEHGTDWYDYLYGWYAALHRALVDRRLGGALVLAQASTRSTPE